jgi:hypothetical protein
MQTPILILPPEQWLTCHISTLGNLNHWVSWLWVEIQKNCIIWLKVVSCNCNWNLFIMKLFKLVVYILSILLLISCLLFFVIIIASLWLWLLLFLLHVIKCFSFEYSQQNLIYNNNKKDEDKKERDVRHDYLV